MAFVDLVECTTSYNIRLNRDNNDIEVMICLILSPNIRELTCATQRYLTVYLCLNY